MNKNEREAGLAPTPQYRYADIVGNRLYVAGQVPLDANGSLAEATTIGEQTKQCLANLFAVIDANGFTRADVHQLTIYVVGAPEDLRAAWSVITTTFDGDVPPATLLGVAALGYDNQLVEIDAHVERI